MLCMNLDIDEPIVVMDIDLILLNNYQDLLEYKIERGQFLGMASWWGSPPSHILNGGFFKYYPNLDKRYLQIYFHQDKFTKIWDYNFSTNNLKVV